MPPITRVEDEHGAVLHDCREAGCEVSWDGIELATERPVEGRRALPEYAKDEGDGRAVVDVKRARRRERG